MLYYYLKITFYKNQFFTPLEFKNVDFIDSFSLFLRAFINSFKYSLKFSNMYKIELKKLL